MKNKTLAIPAALAAIPVNPNRPAMIAITKNINVQRNISLILKGFIMLIIAGTIEIIVPNFTAHIIN